MAKLPIPQFDNNLSYQNFTIDRILTTKLASFDSISAYVGMDEFLFSIVSVFSDYRDLQLSPWAKAQLVPPMRELYHESDIVTLEEIAEREEHKKSLQQYMAPLIRNSQNVPHYTYDAIRSAIFEIRNLGQRIGEEIKERAFHYADVLHTLFDEDETGIKLDKAPLMFDYLYLLRNYSDEILELYGRKEGSFFNRAVPSVREVGQYIDESTLPQGFWERPRGTIYERMRMIFTLTENPN